MKLLRDDALLTPAKIAARLNLAEAEVETSGLRRGGKWGGKGVAKSGVLSEDAASAAP